MFEDESRIESVGDGNILVHLEEPANEEDVFTFNEDAPNLVEEFMLHPDGVASLKKLSSAIVKNFDSDWDSSELYREQVAKDLKVLMGDLPKKDFPYSNCANVHIPIALENISRICFRAYGELFNDWSNVFGVVPTGPGDDALAQVLTKHGNWQIREQIPDFKRQMHRGLMAFLFNGDVTAHSYFDEITERNRHEILMPDEFVIPYTYTTTMPDYSDVPRMTKVMAMYRHELEAMAGKGWYDVDSVLDDKAPSWSDDPDRVVQRAAAEVNQLDIPEEDQGAPRKILWHEGWYELPGNDRLRFIQAFIDYSTRAVLRLTIHERPDWQDQQRFDRENAELQDYLISKQAYTNQLTQHADMLQQQSEQYGADIQQHEANSFEGDSALAAAVGGGLLAPHEAHAAGDFLKLPTPPAPMAMPTPVEPVAPAWMQDPESGTDTPKPVKRVPVHMFAHGVCIEPLVGNLGVSFGRIQADFNRAANTAINQFVDAATLGNCSSFIAAAGVEFVGPFEMAPGKVNVLKSHNGNDLKSNFFELRPNGGNPQLVELADRMYAYGQSSIQAPSVLSGEPGKSGETFRGISARIEQATKQLSVATEKFADFLKQILMNNAALNATFLRDEEVFAVANSVLGAQEELRVGRQMYERNYRVEIRSDLRFATMAQRISEADEMIELPNRMPPLQGSLAFLYEATKKALEARGRQDMVSLLGPPPPHPMTPFGLAPPAPPGPPPPPGGSGSEAAPEGPSQPGVPGPVTSEAEGGATAETGGGGVG